MTRSTPKNLRLPAFLPYRLSVLSNTVSGNIAALYVRKFGLSLWQWRVMAVVGESAGISATEIGKRTAMDKVAVSRAVSGLIELGYLARRASERDARKSSLTLSHDGLAIYQKIVPLALEAERNLIADLTDDEQTVLENLLNKLAAAAAPDRALW
jgi:DNA-binding MarR family transcriptional regulator